jgi:predicted Zn finger-like uncharacterized protein
MDVTCERCGTEYEFDETLLSGRGTSVKCTNCGHVFKVYPKGAADADRTTSSWRLRLKTGEVDAIDSLRELQRRISSGELTPDDEIARGDESWKTLGSIPELETFFRAAGFEVPSGHIPSPLPPVMPPPQRSESSLPPGKRPRQATLLGVSPAARPAEAVGAPVAAAVPEARAPEVEPAEPAPEPALEAEPQLEPEPPGPSAPERSYRSPYTRDSMPEPEIEDAEFEEKRPATPSVRTSTQPPAYYEDDDDIPDLPDRGRSPLQWLLLIVLIGGAALVATQWDRVAQLAGFGADTELIAESVAEGDAAIEMGHPDGYASAIEAYGRGIEAGATNDARLYAKLSRAYALAAQARLDDNAGADVGELSSAAMLFAESATKLDRQGVPEQLAYVDALRLAGSNEEARERLEEVRAVSFSRTAEFFRIDARLSAAEADGRLENGLRSARQAAELAPESIPYLLLAARAEAASGRPERAKERLDTVLAIDPSHPTASGMLAALAEPSAAEVAEALEGDEGAEAGTEAVGTEDASPADAEATKDAEAEEASAVEAPSPDPPPAAEPPKPEPAPAKKAERRPEEPKAPAKKKATEYDEYDRLARAAGSDAFVDGRPPVLDYESNMSKGRAELEAGNYARARAYFDSALEVHPGSADAMDALGDVATAVSDYASALRYYRVAAQRGRMDGYFKLGKTYEKLGKTEEAVSAYYTYIKRRPRGPHAAEARNAITTLEPRAKLPPEPEPESQAPAAEPEPRGGDEPATSESTTP